MQSLTARAAGAQMLRPISPPPLPQTPVDSEQAFPSPSTPNPKPLPPWPPSTTGRTARWTPLRPPLPRRALLRRRPRLPPPLPRSPPRRRQHAAAQPVALGHGRRVRIPVPELLPVPRQAQEQDRGRAAAAQPV
jgi:hypothetical protein